MKILKSVVDCISKEVSELRIETGGILGSHNDENVDEVIIDLPNFTNIIPCSYFPNVDFLNHAIESWQNEGISFKGIFHTHFCGVKTLSSGDIKYINAIMNAMPQQVDFLYFPVFVLPLRELVCYKATRLNGIVEIKEDDLIIV